MADDKEKPGLLEGHLVGALKDWSRGKSLEDLMLVEVGDETLIPDTLFRYNFAKKEIYEVKVYVRVARTFELMRARVKALAAVAKETKRDPATFLEEDAVKVIGQGRWDAVERLYLYQRLLRRFDDPSREYMTVENLDECHPPTALLELDHRIAAVMQLMDRRLHIDDMANSEPLFWAVVERIAKRKNLSPLVAIAGHDQESLVVFMAVQLETFRQKQSSED